MKPGSVAGRYLVNKLIRQGMCLGSRMPRGGAALPTAQVNLVRSWSCAGAPNN